VRIGRQILIFGLVGVVNSLVHYLVFLLGYRVLGVPMLIASAVGYGCGVLNSYFMNRRWTFRVASKRTFSEFLCFAMVNLVALGINLVGLQVLTGQGHLAPEIAQIMAMALALLVNFGGNRLWTFKPKDER
jgi:putative flippase GtrA